MLWSKLLDPKLQWNKNAKRAGYGTPALNIHNTLYLPQFSTLESCLESHRKMNPPTKQAICWLSWEFRCFKKFFSNAVSQSPAPIHLSKPTFAMLSTGTSCFQNHWKPLDSWQSHLMLHMWASDDFLWPLKWSVVFSRPLLLSAQLELNGTKKMYQVSSTMGEKSESSRIVQQK